MNHSEIVSFLIDLHQDRVDNPTMGTIFLSAAVTGKIDVREQAG